MSGSTLHASIVIVAHNELKYTKFCIESVLKHTQYPHKLVLVDNGSTDGTEDHFRSIDGAVVIRNETNAGFPRGANSGLRAADGAYIVLLKNDTIVTAGWLEKLVQAAESDETVGLVGPLTNHSKGDQLLESRDFQDMKEIEQYAEQVADRNAGQRQATNGLAGFCMLIKNEVVERIDYLDEQFGIGNFEDDDYCVRALQAGFKLLIAMDCFIYHFGERTFLALGIEGEEWLTLLRENESLFREKWGQVSKADERQSAAASKLVEQGRRLLEQGDHLEALRAFVQALKESPANEAAYAGSGVALWRLGKKQEAYESFKRALKINPDLEEAARDLAAVAAELGKETDAVGFLAEIRGGRHAD